MVDQWPFPGCLEALRPHYERARKEANSFRGENLRRGVGIAGGAFGIGGIKDQCLASVELNPDGGLTVFASVADPGEGNDAMLTQIAAHQMGIPPEKIRLVTRDTDRTPVSGPAAGSRITYMAGGALIDAIELLKKAMAEANARNYEDMISAGKPTRYLGRKILDTTPLDPVTGQGSPWDSRVLGVQMAEVEVNTRTGEARVLKMTAVEDLGKIINPQAVEGQMQGGMDMGAGMALREHYVHGKSKDWSTYKFPTMDTAFDMEVITLETPRKRGPLGAVGVGEFVLLPTSASILNAIQDAIGVRIHDLPATPQRILEALARNGKR